MKNYGFILKPDVFSLLQSKCHYLWIKLKESLLLKWYFHFKPNVFVGCRGLLVVNNKRPTPQSQATNETVPFSELLQLREKFFWSSAV